MIKQLTDNAWVYGPQIETDLRPLGPLIPGARVTLSRRSNAGLQRLVAELWIMIRTGMEDADVPL
jgi:hypothetical protein